VTELGFPTIPAAGMDPGRAGMEYRPPV